MAGTPVHANPQSGEVWYAGAGIALVGTIGGYAVSERRRKRRQRVHDDCFAEADGLFEDNEPRDWHNDRHEEDDMNFDELCDRLFNSDEDFWQNSHHSPSEEPVAPVSHQEMSSVAFDREPHVVGRSLRERASSLEFQLTGESDTALLAAGRTATKGATQPTNDRNTSSWWRKINVAGFFCGLLLAAMLLAKGYRFEQSPTRAIEQVRVGERVIVDAPEEALATDFARLNGRDVAWNANDGELEVEDTGDPLRALTNATLEQIKRADYRLIKLRAYDVWPDGTLDQINVQTLQPWQWIQEHEVRVGGEARLPLDAEEMGLDEGMRGTVLDILSCPEFEKGRGRIVLTTVNHLNRDVRELTLRSLNGSIETLRPTGNHKFYSVSRGEWLAASDLQNGERLDGIKGEVTVVASRIIPGTHRVYNFTVQGEHLYRVATCGVLVHNNGCLSRLPDFRNSRLAAEHFAKHARGVIVKAKGRLIPKAGGPDMPEVTTFRQYREAARRFHSGPPPSGVHEAVRANGDFVRFDPATGNFGVRTSDGIIKTFFRPDGDAIAQMEYLLSQLF